MKKSEIFWQTYINLEKELLEVAKYIYVTDEVISNEKGVPVSKPCYTQLDTFSPYLADLLVRACIEIESISKELYFDLGGTKPRDNNLLFDTDCLQFIDSRCKTHKKLVLITCSLFNLLNQTNKCFSPLKNAHKRQGTDWERAYQALKHDRYLSLSKGTVRHLIHAMGALYLLNIYYRDEKLYSKYIGIKNLDYSLGSAVFSVAQPSQDYVTSVVNNKDVSGILEAGDSPFVLKFTDSCYKQILKANEEEANEMQNYWNQQPESNDPEFLLQLYASIKREKEEKGYRCIPLIELCKYRLNKKIPPELPFEERKRLFVNSSEWKGRLRQQNTHLEEEELSEDNIQKEIDKAGNLAGMELGLGFVKTKMNIALTDGDCELIIDKGNVRYRNE